MFSDLWCGQSWLALPWHGHLPVVTFVWFVLWFAVQVMCWKRERQKENKGLLTVRWNLDESYKASSATIHRFVLLLEPLNASSKQTDCKSCFMIEKRSEIQAIAPSLFGSTLAYGSDFFCTFTSSWDKLIQMKNFDMELTHEQRWKMNKRHKNRF